MGIGSEAVGEGIDGVLVGMETKVLLFRGEVDEIALEAEGGHTPGYFSVISGWQLWISVRRTVIRSRTSPSKS